MASEKRNPQITVDELEKQFTKLSLKVERTQSDLASKGYRQEPPMKMPVLRRRDTREECIHKIDQIIALNEELQKSIQEKVERWEAEETGSLLSGLLHLATRCL
ncbi:hypothetical protein PG985_010386 [Apiospora marii]|uniref:uncharacterized protein n=1 Tax=Apiospora marii TaxID=335849 RepID=UPI00313212A8